MEMPKKALWICTTTRDMSPNLSSGNIRRQLKAISQRNCRNKTKTKENTAYTERQQLGSTQLQKVSTEETRSAIS